MNISLPPSYLAMAHPEYSPTTEPLLFPPTLLDEAAPFRNTPTTLPDYAFDNNVDILFDYDVFFDGHGLNATGSNFTASKEAASPVFNATLPAYLSPFHNPPRLARNQQIPGVNMAISTNDTHNPLTSTSDSSPSLSPRSLKRLSFSDTDHSGTESATPEHPRKRGRRRLKSGCTGSLGNSCQSRSPPAGCPSGRLSHNEVERRYRESLNSGFERLRRNVPTLRQMHESEMTGGSKPSKLEILTAAVHYIKRIEQERNAALRQIEILEGRI